jgi:adenylate cyclase
MSAAMSEMTHARVLLWLRIIGLSAALGALYAIVSSPPHVASYAVAGPIGVVYGVIIGGSSALDIFVLRRGGVPWLDSQPLLVIIALRTLVYGGVSAAVAILQPVERLFGVASHYDQPSIVRTIVLTLAVATVMVIVFQAAALVGYRTFVALILGKYRQPRAERRFFLFVDVVGSTRLAERLGPLQAHRFLGAVFKAIAEPVAHCRGEIYQYVGDEIVVTWDEAGGAAQVRALRCYFEMRAALVALAPQFRTRFGVDPELRAALHLGEVIAGEVGESRRAIVYHGDVMNTTGRLEQATREIACRFIASADALSALGPLPGLQTHDLGMLPLRGRIEPIRASCVERFEGTTVA